MKDLYQNGSTLYHIGPIAVSQNSLSLRHAVRRGLSGGAAAGKWQQNAEFFDLPHEQTPVDP